MNILHRIFSPLSRDYRIDMIRGPAGDWYSKIIATNGDVVYTSPMEQSHAKAAQTATRVGKAARFPVNVNP